MGINSCKIKYMRSKIFLLIGILFASLILFMPSISKAYTCDSPCECIGYQDTCSGVTDNEKTCAGEGYYYCCCPPNGEEENGEEENGEEENGEEENGGIIGNGITLQNPLEATEFEDILDNVIDFIFNIAVVLVPLMIIIAGFLFVTAGGNAEQINKAKTMIIWTAIGFLIILLSKGIMGIITNLLGVG